MAIVTRLPSFVARPSVLVTAVLFMASAALLGQCVNVGIRFVSDNGMHPFEIVFFRTFFGLLMFVPWLLRAGSAGLKTERLGLHLFRGCLQVASMLAYFTAVTLIPIAEATALTLSIPVVVSLAAIVILGERARLYRWIGIAGGVLGALVILRPGLVTVTLGAFLAVLSVFFSAGMRVTAKMLLRTDTPAALVCYMTMVITPLAFISALPFWTWPSLGDLAWLAAMGAMATGSHLITAFAYQRADLTLLEPIGFTSLVWAAALGYGFFGEMPSLYTWLGAAIIVAAATYLTHRESRAARPAVAAASGPVH